jgi:sugar phosphate isomerase/epimerase
MNPDESPSKREPDPAKLCIHTITHKPWSIEQCGKAFEKAGVRGITVWRDTLEGRDVRLTGKRLRDHGLDIVSLCRGGFFPHKDDAGKRKAFADNRSAIDTAADLGAPLIVLVCGAVPGQPLEESRRQIRDGIEAILPHAEAHNIKLAIEPLHPMYADDRSAVNTLGQANDLAEAINSPYVGVAIDVYHLWWDPALQTEIARCGRLGKIFAYHICDWRTPTEDLLLDRGLMGEGCIDLPRIRQWIHEAGFQGYHEVEVFSKRWWAQDQDAYLAKIIEAYRDHA